MVAARLCAVRSGKTAMDGATLKADEAGIPGHAATGPPNSLAFFSEARPRGLFHGYCLSVCLQDVGNSSFHLRKPAFYGLPYERVINTEVCVNEPVSHPRHFSP